MSYQIVPQMSPVPSSEDCALHPDDNVGNRRGNTRHLSSLQTILLIAQVTLILVHMTGAWHPTEVKYTQETYGFDTRYMTLDHAQDWLWQERAVERAGALALKRDDNGTIIEYGVISMFHQLHCVASLRRALQNAYEGGHVAFNQDEDPHWPHCLHYLYQMIICNSDGQIEGQEVWNQTIRFVSGSKDTRQCKNSRTLFDLYEEKGV